MQYDAADLFSAFLSDNVFDNFAFAEDNSFNAFLKDVSCLKFVKKPAAVLCAFLLFGSLTLNVFAVTEYGASAVRENQTYTLERMLTYAIEDEYLAYERYQKDIELFGAIRPFTNIVRAENAHITLLGPLFKAYSVLVPENLAAQHLTVPQSLAEALKAGVEGERLNMRMYDLFLRQEIPGDVRMAFALLRNAAENHLRAFERALSRAESGAPRRNS
jgi:hypothetical protein